jgi:hypothetical protein
MNSFRQVYLVFNCAGKIRFLNLNHGDFKNHHDLSFARTIRQLPRIISKAAEPQGQYSSESAKVVVVIAFEFGDAIDIAVRPGRDDTEKRKNVEFQTDFRSQDENVVGVWLIDDNLRGVIYLHGFEIYIAPTEAQTKVGMNRFVLRRGITQPKAAMLKIKGFQAIKSIISLGKFKVANAIAAEEKIAENDTASPANGRGDVIVVVGGAEFKNRPTEATNTVHMTENCFISLAKEVQRGEGQE